MGTKLFLASGWIDLFLGHTGPRHHHRACGLMTARVRCMPQGRFGADPWSAGGLLWRLPTIPIRLKDLTTEWQSLCRAL